MTLSNETKLLLEKINAYIVLMGGTSTPNEELAELKFSEILKKLQPNGIHLDVACEYFQDTRKTSPWSLPLTPIVPFQPVPAYPPYNPKPTPPPIPTIPDWPGFPNIPTIPDWPGFPNLPIITCLE